MSFARKSGNVPWSTLERDQMLIRRCSQRRGLQSACLLGSKLSRGDNVRLSQKSLQTELFRVIMVEVLMFDSVNLDQTSLEDSTASVYLFTSCSKSQAFRHLLRRCWFRISIRSKIVRWRVEVKPLCLIDWSWSTQYARISARRLRHPE